MLINGYYIDFYNWVKKAANSVKFSEKGQYVVAKKEKELNVEHKLKFMVKNEFVAKQLQELFQNSEFHVVVIEGCDIAGYDGVYNLMKGSISADGGSTAWVGTIWLEDKAGHVRYSARQQQITSERAYILWEHAIDLSSVHAGRKDTYGTWSSNPIRCTADGGSEINRFTQGTEAHSNNEMSVDILLNTLVNEEVGLLVNYLNIDNYVKYSLFTDPVERVELSVIERGVETILFVSDSLPISMTTTNKINLKIIYAAGRYDLFYDNIHLTTIYDYTIVSGSLGIMTEKIDTEFSDWNAYNYPPPTYRAPAGHLDYKNPMPPSYTRARDGLLQNFVNFEEEVINKIYPSRIHVGEVRVWDTNDNDFSQAFIKPEPLRWTRVYDKNHNFNGLPYIENGLIGNLFTIDEIQIYVYDEANKKGSVSWLDFRQHPNREIWNNAQKNRKFQSGHQSFGNWTEEGLYFEAIDGQLGSDIVENLNAIPELTSNYFRGEGIKFSTKFKPIFNKRIDATRSLFSQAQGLLTIEGSTGTVSKSIFYKGADESIELQDGGTIVVKTDADTFPFDEFINLEVIDTHDYVDEALVYKNGLLLEREGGVTSTFNKVAGTFAIGNRTGSTERPFNGIIQEASARLTNQGYTIPRQLKQPLVYHSFDLENYDGADDIREFKDKGSAAVDLTVNGTGFEWKTDGRYNECIQVKDAGNGFANNTGLTTELDGMWDSYTVEFWMKYTDTVADFQYLLRVGIGSGNDTDTCSIFFHTSLGLVFQFGDNASSNTRGTSISASNFTDGEWHHVAMTVDLNAEWIQTYIDGVTSGANDFSGTGYVPYKTPSQMQVGDGTVDCYIDELIISDYVKFPHEFGVMLPDLYETGQIYSKYEFYYNEHGTLMRRSNTQSPVFKLEVINGIPSDNVSGTIGVLNGSNIALYAGGVGLGLRGTDDINNSGVYFEPTNDQIFRPTSDYTVQFHYMLDKVVDNISTLIYFRDVTGGSTPHYIRLLSTEKIELSSPSATITIDTDNSFALSVDKLYQISIVYDMNGSTGKGTIYIDGVFYADYNISGMVEKNTMHLAIGGVSNYQAGTISNLTIHHLAIPVRQLGFIIDDQELPVYYGRAGPTDDNSEHTFTQYILESIGPEMVEINLRESAYGLTIPYWMESGNPFMYFDWNENKVGGRASYGTHIKFDGIFKPTYAMAPRWNYQAGWTAARSRTPDEVTWDIGFQNMAHPLQCLFLSGAKNSQMIFVQTMASFVDGTDQTFIHSPASADEMFWMGSRLENESVQIFGIVPYNAANQTFFPITAMSNRPNGSMIFYSDGDSDDNTFLTLSHIAATQEIMAETEFDFNNK
ncbi:hypothetical protein LCGC14_1438600, partial [marine sediment metagenome]